MNHVSRLDRTYAAKRMVWHYDILKNPYDTQCLLVRVFDSSGFKQLQNHDGQLLNDTVFAILRNLNDEFFIKIVRKNELAEKMAWFDNAIWKDCYIISHQKLDFSRGKDLVFQNQLLKVLKNSGHVANFSLSPIDVDTDLILGFLEKKNYGTFWNQVLHVLYSPHAQIAGWNTLWDKEQIMSQNLFNKTKTASTVEKPKRATVPINPAAALHLLSLESNKDIIKYTLEDELGNVTSGSTLAGAMCRWLKKLYKVPKYKAQIVSLLEYEWHLSAHCNHNHNAQPDFFQWGNSTGYYIGTHHGYDFSLNIIKNHYVDSRNNLTKNYLTTADYKKRLSILSTMFDLSIDLKEEFAVRKEQTNQGTILEQLAKQNAEYDKLFEKMINELQQRKEQETSKAAIDTEDTDTEAFENDEEEGATDHDSNALIRSGAEFDRIVEELKSFKIKKSDASNVFKN